MFRRLREHAGHVHKWVSGRDSRVVEQVRYPVSFPQNGGTSPPYRPRASKVAGMSERTWMPQWSAERVTTHCAGTVQ